MSEKQFDSYFGKDNSKDQLTALNGRVKSHDIALKDLEQRISNELSNPANPVEPDNPGHDVQNPIPQTLRIEIVPVNPTSEGNPQGQQTVVVGTPSPPAEPAEDVAMSDYLERLDRFCGLNTAMLMSAREEFRYELIKSNLGFFEDIEEFDTVEKQRKRLPLKNDWLFDIVADVLSQWREGDMGLGEAYGMVRYSLENPDRVKMLAAGTEDEDEDEEEQE